MPGGGDLAVIVVAAGRSARMPGVDKVFAPLRGQPVLAHSLGVLESSPEVAAIVLVAAGHNIGAARQLVRERPLSKTLCVTVGGARRQDSVARGLEALAGASPAPRLIAVHDGARPFIDEAMIQRGLEAARRTGAAVAAVPVKDTIKEAGPDRIVTGTPDRARLWAVQTPQVFSAELLCEAHRAIDADVTDDAAMVELAGGAVSIFEGSPQNIKVTTAEDLLLAELIAAERAGESFGTASGAAELRWGTGFDGHRLAPGIPLKLGGVEVPFELGLEGHSDGDVLLHAVASAILGAGGLGGLGAHFPPGAPELEGIDSRRILRRAADVAAGHGWMVAYVDATIIAQRPKLSPYLERIQLSIAGTLGVAAATINVKATSTDRVGAIGAGEGIAAQAIATLRAR